MKNHSVKFWDLVGELMPGYQAHRKSLKKDGWRYVL
ncbi:YgjP-like metallopeptidase domain-containing protein [Methanosarcina mazei]|nr:YgjP-like metallopeptidase domain-containing protein [Methanosarcina mazei]